MIHGLLCILSPCHTVKSSPVRIQTGLRSRCPGKRQRNKAKEKKETNRCRDEEKNGNNRGRHREEKSHRNKIKKKHKKRKERDKTYLKLSFLCTVTYISYTLPWGTAPAGTNKLTPAGGTTREAEWMQALIMRSIDGFINFTMHNWIIECATHWALFQRSIAHGLKATVQVHLGHVHQILTHNVGAK